MRRWLMVFAAVLSNANCGGDGEPPEEGILEPDEVANFEYISARLRSTQLAYTAADELLGVAAPVIDPHDDTTTNISRIQNRTLTELGGCGVVTVVDVETLSIDLGPGCTTVDGVTMAGRATAYTHPDNSIGIVLGDDFLIDGVPSQSLVSLLPSGGPPILNFDTRGEIESGEFDLLLQTIPGPSITFDGAVVYTGNRPASVGFNNVSFETGSCYPSAGNAAQGGMRVSFDENTSASGQVTIALIDGTGNFNQTFHVVLPAYGSCPRE